MGATKRNRILFGKKGDDKIKRSSMAERVSENINTAKEMGKDTVDIVTDMVTGLPSLPWKKLPLSGWLFLISMLIIMLLMLFVLVPIING